MHAAVDLVFSGAISSNLPWSVFFENYSSLLKYSWQQSQYQHWLPIQEIVQSKLTNGKNTGAGSIETANNNNYRLNTIGHEKHIIVMHYYRICILKTEVIVFVIFLIMFKTLFKYLLNHICNLNYHVLKCFITMSLHFH